MVYGDKIVTGAVSRNDKPVEKPTEKVETKLSDTQELKPKGRKRKNDD